MKWREEPTPTFRCADGLDLVLGQYDGNASITTRVRDTDAHDLLGQVTWHELHHYGLQAGTPWGIAYSVMVRIAGQLTAVVPAKTASILKNARTVHEMYATYYTAGQSGELLTLIKNDRYIGYWSAANSLRHDLFDDNPDWHSGFELLFDKLMSDSKILDLSVDSSLEDFAIALRKAAPDDRYEALNKIVKQEGQALLDIRRIFLKSIEPETLDQHLSDVLTFYGIACSASDSLAPFAARMTSGPRRAGAAISIVMGPSKAGDKASVNPEQDGLIYTDTLLQLSDIESLQLREMKRTIDLSLESNPEVKISDFIISSQKGDQHSAILLIMSRSALERQFRLRFGEATGSDELLLHGILSAPVDGKDALVLLQTDPVGPLVSMLRRNSVSVVFLTTSSTPLPLADLSFDSADLIVLVDGPRFVTAVALTRQWMFLSYRVFNLGRIPLTVIVARSGGAPSPRFVFVCTNLTAMYLVDWFDRQSSCAPDNDLDDSGIREVMTHLLNSFFVVGGYATVSERPTFE